MIDSLTGFAWSNLIVKTINGGGPFNSIERISESISTEFKLKQNYPNPFNSSTVIEFDIPQISVVSLIVYDLLGREDVKVIESKELEPGSYKTLLDLNNYNLSSGIYFCKLIAIEKNKGDIFEQTKKLIYNK